MAEPRDSSGAPIQNRTENSTYSPIWVCHKCQMLGSEEEAAGHRENTGHEPERLSDEMSEWVHEELFRQRARRAVALMEAARLRKRALGQKERNPE